MTSQSTSKTVRVGTVIRPHGLRGDLLVDSLSDVAERFECGREVLLRARTGQFRTERICRSSVHKDRLLLHFEGCDDRTSAEGLKGCELHVARSDVPGAPDGEYYYFQLIDCLCRDKREGDLGLVVAIIEDGGGLLLQVERGGQKVLIPFVESFIRKIDLEGGKIDLELPPGLLETCASTS